MSDTGIFETPEGATPLDAKAISGLKLKGITTRDQLNSAEQLNILKAINWCLTSRKIKTANGLLEVTSQKLLHKQMYGDVWNWAGQFRKVDTNIGCPWPDVPTQLVLLLGDVQEQIRQIESSPWTLDELAIRFHHRLVSIHPFTNGNGRHARLSADLLIRRLGGSEFSWGSRSTKSPEQVRSLYLNCLRKADHEHVYDPLIAFARS
ncbi:MAG: hypothetical protein RIS75_925 [Actinomycetota bacterium]|jgi:Fic-DOC domain mobile mystery protein B